MDKMVNTRVVMNAGAGTEVVVTTDDDTEPGSKESGKQRQRKHKQKQKLNMPPNVYDDYISADEGEKGIGGRKIDPQLIELAWPCYHKKDLKQEEKLCWCIGMKNGCT